MCRRSGVLPAAPDVTLQHTAQTEDGPPYQEFHTLASGRRGEQLFQASALSFGPANTDSWFRERFDPSNACGPIIGPPVCVLHLWNQLKCLLPRQSRTRGTGPVHSGARRVSKGYPMRLIFWRSDLSSVSIFAALNRQPLSIHRVLT